MHVPLTVLDFIERAELVYGNRAGVVDEPNQPAESLGTLTWSEIGRLARAQAAGLDALGVAQGERVAIVSHNSARLLTSFFGVSAYGRVLVPINFRLSAEEVGYIVEHSGASVLLVDPELENDLSRSRPPTASSSAKKPTTNCCASTPSPNRGSPTKKRRARSITRAARPPARKACSSRTEASG